jgi:hypothetical protein
VREWKYNSTLLASALDKAEWLSSFSDRLVPCGKKYGSLLDKRMGGPFGLYGEENSLWAAWN